MKNILYLLLLTVIMFGCGEQETKPTASGITTQTAHTEDGELNFYYSFGGVTYWLHIVDGEPVLTVHTGMTSGMVTPYIPEYEAAYRFTIGDRAYAIIVDNGILIVVEI